ncbi:MAG TPA: type II CAAX endopeptidase family protein [Blastocatellia bacterium]|nr:type II CAAX endopeptidase family protein [Blastocatellia bacterium]
MQSHFRRIPFLAVSGFVVLFITLFVQGVWAGLLVTNLKTSPKFPWSVAVMAIFLCMAWWYASGKGWPGRTSEIRGRYLRANSVSAETFAWALLAGGLSIVALAGAWILLFKVVKMPGNRAPDFSAYPITTTALVLIMASIVGGVAEEAGFRGYFQSSLERDFSASFAIMISALFMSPGHGLSQGFAWPMLLWYFFADVMFGVTAYLTNSILPGIVLHIIGLFSFFTLIWPDDRSRVLVVNAGADIWFWIHIGQAIIFSVLAILAFGHLARVADAKGADLIRIAA